MQLSMHMHKFLMRGRIAFAMALTAIVSGSLFLGFGAISRRELVVGYLEPSEGMIRIRAQTDGQLIALNARPGVMVEPGQVLAIVQTTTFTQQGIDAKKMLSQELKNEIGLLEEQLESETAAYPMRSKAVKEQIEATERQLYVARKRGDAILELERFASRNLARLQDLEQQGFVSGTVLDKALSEVASQSAAVLALNQETERLSSELARLNAIFRSLELDHRQQVLKNMTDISRRKQALNETFAQQSYSIVSPIAGEVASTRGEPGDSIKGGTLVVSLIPKEAHLRGILLVPSRAMAFVKPGMEVELAFDAFPYAKYGTHRGQVEVVEEAVVLPQEQAGPLNVMEPVYRVKVALKAQSVRAYGADIRLRPDMTFQASLIRDRRRVYEWLIDPLLALSGRTP